jgi:hypothetical protein
LSVAEVLGLDGESRQSSDASREDGDAAGEDAPAAEEASA